jgi:hypothetical protein
MSREKIIAEVDETLACLTEFRRRMANGEELCQHHYNHSDRCFESYCTGCGKHLGERHSITDVPFKADAYCYSCSRKRQGGA